MHYFFALTLVLLPTYVFRFELGLPVNLLMVWVCLLWLVFVFWLWRTKQMKKFYGWLRSELQTFVGVASTVFLLSGIVATVIAGISHDAFGQLLVLFIQPIGTFLLVRYLLSINTRHPVENAIVNAAYIFVGVSGVYAIIQYMTLWGVPVAWWGNAQEPKRALSFFLHPNFYALFVTPLLAFLIPSAVGVLIKDKRLSIVDWLSAAAWVFGAIGLFLSLSRGGWLGLAAAVAAFLLVAGNKRLLKLVLAIAAISVIVILSVPNFRYRLLLPFMGEKSAVSRLSLWNTGWKQIKQSPVAGQGLLGFSNNWATCNSDPNLGHHPTPHNLYLALWVDTGLLGLGAFLGLCALALWRGFRKHRTTVQLGLALAVVALLVHGFVDTPYLKNDLALLFWLLYGFM